MPSALSAVKNSLRTNLADKPRKQLVILAGILTTAVGLRLWLMLSYRPALLGYPDSGAYINAAVETIFRDSLRPGGYPLFLRFLHLFSNELSFVTLVQHCFGLLGGVLVYLTAAKITRNHWIALLPAAVFLLNGTQLFFEHAVLTESIYTFLLIVVLYLAVSHQTMRYRYVWLALIGLLLGTMTITRVTGMVLIPVLALWVLYVAAGSLSSKLKQVLVIWAALSLVIGSYVGVQAEKRDFTGLTRSNNWVLYGRVAPFADCSKFTPPKGTEMLCESTLPAQRPGLSSYLFAPSPATRAYGSPEVSTAEHNKLLREFALQAMLHQPGSYLWAVSTSLGQYVFPKTHTKPGYGFTPEQFNRVFFEENEHNVGHRVAPYYSSNGFLIRNGMLKPLRSYYLAFTFQGAVMLILLLCSLLAITLNRGRLRVLSVLFFAVAALPVAVTSASVTYEYRYLVPSLPPLLISASLGLYAVLNIRQNKKRPAGEVPIEPVPPAP